MGAAEVYFQKPSNVQMVYPAIIYERDYAETHFAGNSPYAHMFRYQLTVIDEEADSPIIDLVKFLPRCVFVRHFAADNLNHDIFSIYF